MGMFGKAFALCGVAVAAIWISSNPVLAGPTGITTSDPALVPYTLPYGDFNVVSLQYADVGTGTKNYYIASSPGNLVGDNAIVVGTGTGNGNFANGGPLGASAIPGIDAPYATENGKQVSSFTTADPTVSPVQGQFAGDVTGTWNAQIGALNTALNNTAPVFYFNLNEQGGKDGLSQTDLLLWAKVTITTAPTTVGGVQVPGTVLGTWYVAGNPFDPNNVFGPGAPPAPNTCTAAQSPYCYAPGGTTGSSLWNNTNENYGITTNPTGVAPTLGLTYENDSTSSDLNPATDCASSPFGCTDYPSSVSGTAQSEWWSLVHGNICVNGPTLVHYGSCTGGEGTTVSQNQGANQAAFAAYSLNLDSLIASLGDSSTDVLNIDWEMADEDNGYEQLFILGSGQPITPPLPEPVTLSLFGMGLVGVVALRRRRKA